MSRIFQDIPSKWNLRKLDSITEDIKSGFASGKRDENGIVQLRMNNVDVGGNINLEKTLKVPIPKNIEDYLLQNGDVLFNNTNSVDLIGKTSIFNDEIIPCTYSNHLTRIRGDSTKVDQKWILYILISLWKKGIFYRICNRHVGQAGITSKDINNLRIPVPPLVEQRGIVEVLGTVDECIRLTDAVIERAEELKRGLMQQLLTRGIGHTEYKETPLGEIPKTWEIKEGRKIFKIVSGYAPATITFTDRNEGEFLYIKVNDMNHELNQKVINTSENKFSIKDNGSIALLPKNTLIFAKRGAAIFKNRVRILNENSTIDTNLMGLILNKDINLYFIYYQLIHKKLYRLVENAGIPQLNNKQIYPLKFVIPPRREQDEIVNRVNEIYTLVLNEASKKKNLNYLKQGIIQLLLSGKTRVELKGDGLHRIRDGREANN